MKWDDDTAKGCVTVFAFGQGEKILSTVPNHTETEATPHAGADVLKAQVKQISTESGTVWMPYTDGQLSKGHQHITASRRRVSARMGATDCVL